MDHRQPSTNGDPMEQMSPSCTHSVHDDTNLQWSFCTVVNIVEVVHDKAHTFVKAPLIEPVQVGKVDLKPTQATFSKRFSFSEHEKSTTEIITDVIKVRWNGVSATTEIKVVR